MTSTTLKVITVDTPNHNGRVYPRAEMERAIDKFNDRLPEHPLFGELGYGPALDGTSISLDRVSHKVDKMFIEGDNVMAKITVMDTPMGNILKTLCEEAPNAVMLGPRGTGVVDEDGNVSEYTLITVDVIQNQD